MRFCWFLSDLHGHDLVTLHAIFSSDFNTLCGQVFPVCLFAFASNHSSDVSSFPWTRGGASIARDVCLLSHELASSYRDPLEVAASAQPHWHHVHVQRTGLVPIEVMQPLGCQPTSWSSSVARRCRMLAKVCLRQAWKFLSTLPCVEVQARELYSLSPWHEDRQIVDVLKTAFDPG